MKSEMSKFQIIFRELSEEINTNKSHLILKYIDMLDPQKNDNSDELELLDKFIEYFTLHKEASKNYIEYMTFLRAYILLNHAAIEDCLENIAKLAIDTSIELYQDNFKINSILKWFILKLSDGSVQNRDDFNDILKILRDKYGETVNDNNGIKKYNLEKIFKPLGITEIDFEPFNDFGELRGNFAHHNGKSAHRNLGLQTPPNPVEYSKNIDFLLNIIDKEIIQVIERAID